MATAGLVLDASVAVAWAFADEADAYAERVLESLAEVEALVPALWPLEVGNAMVMAERRGRLQEAETVHFLALLAELPISVEVLRPEQVWGEIVTLARAQQLSTYDVTYLHLAMRRGLPLATNDLPLRQAAARCGVAIYKI